jgi:hypothetical protein
LRTFAAPTFCFIYDAACRKAAAFKERAFF